MSSLNQCTYDVTGPSNVLQFYRICYTCSENQPYNIPVCLNCVSLCHEDHHLGPVMKDAFFCRCFENDVHFCRASRAAQCHIIRRRAQDTKFKALQQQYLQDQTPYPMNGSLSRKKIKSNDDKYRNESNSKSKYVVWYRVDQRPKAIVKVFDDVDDANEYVKTAFVEYNPWNMSSLELRCLDTFLCSFSPTGLAHYSVSLSMKKSNEQNTPTVIFPVDIAKENASVDQESTSLSQSVSNTTIPSDNLVSKDHPALLEKGVNWEVCAEIFETFLQEYGCEPAPALLSVTPSSHQPVEWYAFPENDPFDPELASAEKSTNNKRNTKKKSVSETTSTSSPSQILYGYHNELKHVNTSKKQISYAETNNDEGTVPLKKSGKKKMVKGSPSSNDIINSYTTPSSKGKGPIPARTIPAMGITAHDFDFDEALPSLTGRKRAMKNRLTKDNEAHVDMMDEAIPRAQPKKTRAPKEVGAPKGPVSSFMFYTLEQRPRVRAEYPHLSITDVTRHMGESWRKLTTEEKEPFEILARQERERYNKEMTDFKANKQEKDATNDLPTEINHQTDENNNTNNNNINPLLASAEEGISHMTQDNDTMVISKIEGAEDISGDDEEEEVEEEEEGDDGEDIDDQEKEYDITGKIVTNENLMMQNKLKDTGEEMTVGEEQIADSSASDILDSSQEETDLEMNEQPEAKRSRLE